MANPIIYASLGGILPALLWLWFWLREDRKNPEPGKLILETFLMGMLAVVLVLPIQKGVDIIWPGMAMIAIISWALFEELFKLGAGYFGGLHTADDNEPIDPIIYMITAALGFVALENTLFILGPLVGGDIPHGIVTANLRFIGASLLHVVSSGIIGVGLSFAFYKNKRAKVLYFLLALVLAIVFHSAFNILIIKFGGQGMVAAFLSVWIGAALLLWAFEYAKSVRP